MQIACEGPLLLKGLRSTPFEKEGGALVPTGALLAALTNALRNEGWQSPIGLLGFRAMKKKHVYNALICMGLFMRKPEVA